MTVCLSDRALPINAPQRQILAPEDVNAVTVKMVCIVMIDYAAQPK